MEHSKMKTYKLGIMTIPALPKLLKMVNIRAPDAEEAYRLAYKRFHLQERPCSPDRLYAEVRSEGARVIGVFIERFDHDDYTFTFGPFTREEPDIGE
jgi:hypothetical protein